MHKWLVVLHVTANLPYDDHDDPRAANAAENTKCGKFAANDTYRFIREEIFPVDPIAAQGPLREFIQWKLEYAFC